MRNLQQYLLCLPEAHPSGLSGICQRLCQILLVAGLAPEGECVGPAMTPRNSHLLPLTMSCTVLNSGYFN